MEAKPILDDAAGLATPQTEPNLNDLPLPLAPTTQAPSAKAFLDQMRKEYGRYVWGTCIKLCKRGDPWWGETEDLVQETWCQAFKWLKTNWPVADDAMTWKAWLAAIARNGLKDFRKREKRKMRRDSKYGYAMAKKEPVDSREKLISAMGDFLDALQNLRDSRMREIVRLRAEGVTWEKIAKELGVSESWARKALVRARKILRAVLEGRNCSAS